MIKRNSSTIPFGYKLGEDNKTLEVVDKEVSALKEMKDGVAPRGRQPDRNHQLEGGRKPNHETIEQDSRNFALMALRSL